MNEQHKNREQHLHKHQYQSLETSGGNCTFCGATIEEDENFCPDCGSPQGGIKCPNCGTLSRRSFCSHCNTPLNDVALEAVRQAKADPAFRRAEALAAELAELERLIEAGGISRAELNKDINEEARKAASRYASLFGDVASIKVPDVPKQQTTLKSKVLTGNPLEAAIATYKAKAQELQQAISSMLPPPSSTPEEQRNFFCARKIMTRRCVPSARNGCAISAAVTISNPANVPSPNSAAHGFSSISPLRWLKPYTDEAMHNSQCIMHNDN